MIKIEHLGVSNVDNAIRGMRNPLESWDKSDSHWNEAHTEFIIGEADKQVALKLIKAGTDHSKFMRQIFVSMDITAPMTWWWDFDTYKVATVRNSTSRMHKLASRLLTFEDFSVDNEAGEEEITPLRKYVLDNINERITLFQSLRKTDPEAAIKLWREILFDLPQNYNFKSTWTGNYQNMRNIYFSRKNHKQREFRDFCKFIEDNFPYAEFITTPSINPVKEEQKI